MLAAIQFASEDVPTPDAVRPKGRRTLELQQLKAKIAKVQSDAAEALKTTDRVMQEQDKMHRQAVRIANDQGKLRVVVKKEEKKLARVEEMKRSITVDHALISSYIDGISQQWRKISPLPAAIRHDQAAVDLTLKAVARQNQAMLQQALVIQQNGIVIEANLLAAAQKVEAIQLNADLVKGGHQAIEHENELIEEKKSELQQKIQELQDLQQQGLNNEIIDDELITKKEGTSGFWTTLVERITTFASWFFSKIVGSLVVGGTEVRRWLADANIHSLSEAINQPASWVILGVFACAAIRNTIFSIACIGLECSLFYYRWSSQNQT